MVIERLKFKNLASGTLTHAHDTIFDKYRLASESHFMNEMCIFSVRNDKMCYEQMSIFVKFLI